MSKRISLAERNRIVALLAEKPLPMIVKATGRSIKTLCLIAETATRNGEL